MSNIYGAKFTKLAIYSVVCGIWAASIILQPEDLSTLDYLMLFVSFPGLLLSFLSEIKRVALCGSELVIRSYLPYKDTRIAIDSISACNLDKSKFFSLIPEMLWITLASGKVITVSGAGVKDITALYSQLYLLRNE